MTHALRVERRDAVALLTLNVPDRRNAMTMNWASNSPNPRLLSTRR